MTDLVGYLLLFGGLAVFFLFIHLVLGRFFRPVKPDPDKLTIYECGEPTIGGAWVQFDLRFYVVALLFVIFDVEVAFFFPWAVVFGKANNIAAPGPPADAEAYHKIGARVAEVTAPHDQSAQRRITRLKETQPKDFARLEELRKKRDQLRQ